MGYSYLVFPTARAEHALIHGNPRVPPPMQTSPNQWGLLKGMLTINDSFNEALLWSHFPWGVWNCQATFRFAWIDFVITSTS